MNTERRRLKTGTAIGYSIAGIADAGLIILYLCSFYTF